MQYSKFSMFLSLHLLKSFYASCIILEVLGPIGYSNQLHTHVIIIRQFHAGMAAYNIEPAPTLKRLITVFLCHELLFSDKKALHNKHTAQLQSANPVL